MPHRRTACVGRAQTGAAVLRVTAAAAALALGVFVYLLDRQPQHVYFIPDGFSLAAGLAPLFGSLGQHLPSFVHVYAFSLLTSAIRPARAASVCLGWFTLDSVLEGAQHPSVGPLVAQAVPEWFGGIPFLENTASYLLRGTFDTIDLVAILAGALAAYVTIAYLIPLRRVNATPR